jgi:hypothetical protein
MPTHRQRDQWSLLLINPDKECCQRNANRGYGRQRADQSQPQGESRFLNLRLNPIGCPLGDFTDMRLKPIDLLLQVDP